MTEPETTQQVPEKMQRLIDMLRPDYYDSSDGDRHWASLYVNFDVGPTPEWEVEWTGLLIEYPADTTAWACDECGSLVVDTAGGVRNRDRHEDWHRGVNRSINEASSDFAGH